MKAKANLKLRKVGGRYMLVDVSDRDANVTNVYTLNDTAAFVWHLLSAGDMDMESLTGGGLRRVRCGRGNGRRGPADAVGVLARGRAGNRVMHN